MVGSPDDWGFIILTFEHFWPSIQKWNLVPIFRAKNMPWLSFETNLLHLSPIDWIGLMIYVSIFRFFPIGFHLKEKLFLA